MSETMYQKMLCRFQALTPMCNYEAPEALCTNEELYFRRIHRKADSVISDMVNLAIEGENRAI